MDFFRRHRVLSFLLFLTLFSVLIAKVIAPRFLNAQSSSQLGQIASTQGSAGAGVCANIGNNGAIQFDNPQIPFEEANYTLALFTGSETQAIISAIKSSPGKIIVRLGAGKDAPGPPAAAYAASLNQIAGAVGGKEFIAMASHNEANCNEHIDLGAERTYAQTVTSAVSAPNVKFITGQVDTYCDYKRLGYQSPQDYINALSSVSKIDGVSLPFYTGVAGDSAATVAQIQGFLKSIGKDVYVTESGPFVAGSGEGNFPDYVNAVKTIINEPKIKALLLFNAFGINTEAAFTYTKPFWSPECREAFRTSCQDVNAVLEACSNPPTSYFEYNIKRKNVASIMQNLGNDYSVACMPKETFKLVAKNREKCTLSGIGCGDWNTTGELNLSAQGKLFGLFRDEKKVNTRVATNKTTNSRMESLETYLGVPNQNLPRAVASPIASPNLSNLSVQQGPIYSLTTLNDQCEMIKTKLEAVNNLCSPSNRIEGEKDGKTKCGLNTRIPGTDFTHLTLWNKIQGDSCEKLMAPPADDVAAGKVRDAILNTPLAMETAYRPAFVVAVTKFEQDPTKNVRSGSEGIKDQTFYTLDYLEVKVPAFGSDFLPADSNDNSNGVNRNYRDPLQKTADLLTSYNDQFLFEKAVTEERAPLKAQVAKVIVNGGLVGDNGTTPTYCYIDGSIQKCQEVQAPPELENEIAQDKIAGPDKLPVALSSFLNAYNNAGLLTKDNLPCDAEEKSFFSDANKQKIAEEVKSLGSDLGTKEKTGIFTKKQSIKVPYSASVTDLTKDLTYTTTTKLYFVSPHNHALDYAQQSFSNFLTLGEQEKLKDLGLLTDSGVLNPEVFTPLSKTEIDDKLTTSPAQRSTRANVEIPEPGATGDKPISPNMVTVSLGLEPNVDDQNQPLKHPLFWQVAGQVASLPTRLMALVTTQKDDFVNKYTRDCTPTGADKETLSHATENWLLGNCKPSTPTAEALQCKVDSKTVTQAEYHGVTSFVSDQAIATAIQVSKYTCMPAEVLIGVLAKESRGLTNVNGTDQPITGDPLEMVTRQISCLSLNPIDSSADLYFRPCGAYQYAQSNIRDQVATYGQAITECLDKVAGGSQDTRLLGVSMCVASANMWRSTYCSKQPGGCSYSQRGSKYGCNNQPYSLDELQAQGYSNDNIMAGVAAFHGNSEANENYSAFIDQYKAQVAKVRGQLSATCTQ